MFVSRELQTLFPSMKLIPNEYLSAIQEFHRGASTGLQVFQVPKSTKEVSKLYNINENENEMK